jgi:hypothetical protein
LTAEAQIDGFAFLMSMINKNIRAAHPKLNVDKIPRNNLKRTKKISETTNFLSCLGHE